MLTILLNDEQPRIPRRRRNVWHALNDAGHAACGEDSGAARPAREFLKPGKLFDGCYRCVTCFYAYHCGVRQVGRR